MLKVVTLKKIGFNNSIKLNDVFDDKEHTWVVRAISENRIKARFVSLGGRSGWQHDVIEAIVVAQRVGTFDKRNIRSKEAAITSTFQISQVNSLSSYDNRRTVKVGDVCELGENDIYLATEVLEISYRFVDVVTELKGVSVTELPLKETQKLTHKNKLNELGWSVV